MNKYFHRLRSVSQRALRRSDPLCFTRQSFWLPLHPVGFLQMLQFSPRSPKWMHAASAGDFKLPINAVMPASWFGHLVLHCHFTHDLLWRCSLLKILSIHLGWGKKKQPNTMSMPPLQNSWYLGFFPLPNHRVRISLISPISLSVKHIYSALIII